MLRTSSEKKKIIVHAEHHVGKCVIEQFAFKILKATLNTSCLNTLSNTITRIEKKTVETKSGSFFLSGRFFKGKSY